MKKAISLILSAGLALSLCGCSSSEAVLDNNIVTISGAGIEFDFPEEYSVYVGDEIYDILGGSYSESSADELKEEHEGSGMKYLAYGVGANSVIMISSQDMTPDEDTERTTLDDYARQVHDTTIFEYYASGYRTTENTSLEEATYGGKDGWVSFFEVTTASGDDEEPKFIIGYIEFSFESGDDIYAVQIGLKNQTDKNTAIKMFENIKSTK